MSLEKERRIYTAEEQQHTRPYVSAEAPPALCMCDITHSQDHHRKHTTVHKQATLMFLIKQQLEEMKHQHFVTEHKFNTETFLFQVCYHVSDVFEYSNKN